MPETSAPSMPTPARSAPVYYDLLLGATAVILILSNIGATKGVELGPIITDGGFFLFPLAYVVGDIMSEIYGFARARKAIIFSFASALFAALCFWVMIELPAASFYGAQQAFETVLAPVPLVVAGSLLGFLVGQLLNAWVMTAMKKRTRGKFLVGRLLGSTVVGELADTLIFCAVAAPIIGIETPAQFINYVLVGYFYKVLVEVVLMPATLPAIAWFRKKEPAYREAYS